MLTDAEFQALLDERARVRGALDRGATKKPEKLRELRARLEEIQTQIDAALREAAKESQL